MAVHIKRRLNSSDGTALAGAAVQAYEVGQSGVVSSTVTDSEGEFEFELEDTISGRTNVLYDIKVTYSGSVWWIRGETEGQLERLDVNKLFRLPRYTTVERDALSLGATDPGTQVYNTTTDQVNTWDGTAWIVPTAFDVHDDVTTQLTTIADADRFVLSDESSGGDAQKYVRADTLKTYAQGGLSTDAATFDLHDDVSDEMTTPASADRLVVSDESVASDPNRWMTLSRLTTYLNGVLSLNASRISAGVLAVARIPNLAASKITSGIFSIARGGTGASTAAGARANLGVSDSAGAFDLHDDVTTEIASIADTDRMLISDENTSGDPNRYVQASDLKTYAQEGLTPGGDFDLHDDLGTELTNPANADRLVASDEGTAGDPNRWLSLTRLATYMNGVLSLAASRITSGTLAIARIPGLAASQITAGIFPISRGGTGASTAAAARTNLGVGDFDLHDDVTTELTNPASADRLVASNEGSTGDPNVWLSLTRLTTYLNGVLSLNASRIGGHACRCAYPQPCGITSGAFTVARIPSLAASKITSGIFPIVRGGTGASNAAAAQGEPRHHRPRH